MIIGCIRFKPSEYELLKLLPGLINQTILHECLAEGIQYEQMGKSIIDKM